MLQTELNERDAFRAVFSFRQTLDGLNPAELPISTRQKSMSWEFVEEVFERLNRGGRGAVGKKRNFNVAGAA